MQMKKLEKKDNRNDEQKNSKRVDKKSSLPAITEVDTAKMRETLLSLSKQLQDTNDEIARQELKLALNSNVKNYERSARK